MMMVYVHVKGRVITPHPPWLSQLGSILPHIRLPKFGERKSIPAAGMLFPPVNIRD